MADLEFSLHPKQLEVFNSPARFKVVPAGRQSGKTTLAIATLICETLRDVSWGGVPLNATHETAYIYPTFDQGKKVVWPRLRAAVDGLGCKIYENTGLIEFPNGRRLRLLGAENFDAIRGFTWSAVVLDEYKDMAANVFEEIVRPALGICQGTALFIGTPKGKNHFYDLVLRAKRAMDEGDEEWAYFTFTSAENPFMRASEIASMTRNMSSQIIAQEIEASFLSHGGAVFKDSMFSYSDLEPVDGYWVVAADLAGFTKANSRGTELTKRDEHAIAVVKVHKEGWWVKEIVHGQWDVRETALRLLTACKGVQTSKIGIEKGVMLQAVLPYLTDLMRQYGRWLDVTPLTHGNQRKADRIQWALQGRAEKGRIVLNPGKWNAKFLEQAMDFPDPRGHDDLIDALAYVDQMATTLYLDEFDYPDQWTPMDSVVGY